MKSKVEIISSSAGIKPMIESGTKWNATIDSDGKVCVRVCFVRKDTKLGEEDQYEERGV